MDPPPKLSAVAPRTSARDASMQLTWADAHARAQQTVLEMSECEKSYLMNGIGWSNYSAPARGYYIGTTPAIPRLGVPSLKMSDAAGGFRTIFPELVGTVTAWPSLLAMAATWDSELVENFGVALGQEFSGKGANGILGPSVNVNRVPRCGRNFEYISGEDPYLGAVLVPAYIRGLHSQGVFTVVKHYILNSQETNRNEFSAEADSQTLHELYHPPFKAAVDAGVGAVMCGYNKIEGEYLCSSEKHLGMLKNEMGFQGFVQSDWWATHATSVAAGLDQEMPGHFPSAYLSYENLYHLDPVILNASAERILATMYRFRLDENPGCAPPDCIAEYNTDQTSDKHRALARSSAADSLVLLKNEDDILPLDPDSSSALKLAVIGYAADSPAYNPATANASDAEAWHIGDFYSGGGSGHVTVAEKYLVSPLKGLKAQAGTNIQVHSSTSDITSAAKTVAKGADIAIVVLATTSGESVDRANLDLDCRNCTSGTNSSNQTSGEAALALVKAVSAETPTIVVVLAPGAVLLPFKDLPNVKAITLMFLAGEQTGNALADVIYGKVAPSGRLPVQLPLTEDDQIPPNPNLTIPYTEGMATSYRSSDFKAAYPFGFGLSYTTFKYSDIAAASCQAGSEPGFCIEVTVTNKGSVASRDVPQLYLEFPKEARHPAPLLKAFHKTQSLKKGASERVVFVLGSTELSYYDADRSAWVEPSSWTAHIGSSAADISESVSFGAAMKVV